jgi:hypothetical protein
MSMEVGSMLMCPICEHDLDNKLTDDWLCTCGEKIPFGFERDDEENCDACPMRDCSRRK